jgi:gamma-glutamylcyclotransferase (GGCT)/AIG2-like uncharacterized protein YtfP
MSRGHLPIFVYGTLQRGEARERCWPRPPQSVEPATVLGALYDLGSYPALVAGDDVVAGELWRFAAEDMAETLTVLDHVECCTGTANDLYQRVIVECQTAGGKTRAWTYHLAQAQLLAGAPRIAPHAQGACSWSRPNAPIDE